MQHQVLLSIFSEEEDVGNKALRRLRDRIFAPVCRFFLQKGITPSMLSYGGLLMVVPFIYFFGFNPWFSFIFLLLNLFLDAVDGPLARLRGHLSVKGAMTDILCDHLSFFIIFLTFLYFGVISPFWAAVYLLNYVLLLTFVVYCRATRVKFFPVIRSKYYFYFTFFVLLLTGHNYFDPFLVLFSVYMVITNIFLFDRIRCSLS